LIADQAVVNARWYEMMGYSPEEIGLTLASFLKTIHPDDVSEVQRRLQDTLDGKNSEYAVKYRVLTKSGKVKHVMCRGKIVSFTEDGRPAKMAGVITDVTEMTRLSDEVNKIHNLESIGLLAGGLAHDFNNVLNIIYGNITFAKMLAGGDSAFVEPLTDAEEACERAKELGIRLQDFSQGSFPEKEHIALTAIIEDAMETLFTGTTISHTITVADGILPVEADPRQIRQVFNNLLTNAKEAMSAGGAVKIDIENYCVAGNHGLPLGPGAYIRIAIQDDGKGIPGENLPKIFDPYFSTKDTYSQRGMGLGLSLCHAITKRHKGHIFVESKLGVGTRVTMYLPASIEEARLSPKG
jgi:PAS domain S-box-containing protein